jgi:hypothetical protein
MSVFAGVVFVALALLSLRGVRWAYVAFIVLGLLYFPIKVGFVCILRRVRLRSMSRWPSTHSTTARIS